MRQWSGVMAVAALLLGCAGGVSATGPAVLLVVAALVVAACSGKPADDAAPAVFDADAGTWNPCCKGGKITTCPCFGGSCNWGYCTNPDGSCGPSPLFGVRPCSSIINAGDATGTTDAADAAPDAVADAPDAPDVADAGPEVTDVVDAGSWHPCCKNGKVATCECSAGTSCNWGYCLHPDGSCGFYGGFGIQPCPVDAATGDSSADDAGSADGCAALPDGACSP